jgi:glycosyltransferase involved in cell wall biosynthesis
MKIALLHYWLTGMRGGEQVLAELCRLFPSADIYTHALNRRRISSTITDHRIRETFIARLPRARQGCQKYLPLMPLALRQLDLTGYDLILSSESGPAKGIRKPRGATHICYCHTPMRYLWDMYDDYYQSAGALGRLAMSACRGYLRRYDLRSAHSVDHFIANSRFVAERIQRIYGREAEVIYPPVHVDFYAGERAQKLDFYLYVGQLTAYKRPDLAIAACRKLKRQLVLVGDGEMRPQLERLAEGDPLIRFVGRVSNDELRLLYTQARALLFPGIEDFGITPVEAQTAGTPVIALGRGGALETVTPGETGLFFDQPTASALLEAMEEFEARTWSPAACQAKAAEFSAARFTTAIAECLHKHLGRPSSPAANPAEASAITPPG